jgi:hypothetical protein
LTEAPDYTTWTWEQHLTKTCELAAEADRIGDKAIPSQATQRLSDVQQIAIRAQMHAALAELKKPETETVLEPLVTVPATAPETTDMVKAEAGATPRRQRQNNKSGGA